jgi:anti-anti-sigma regulatory factor
MTIEVHTRRPFGAREEDVDGWHVVRVTGDVDGHTGGILPTLVMYAVRRGAQHVCLDLTAVERLDRSGAEAVRRCSGAVRYAGGELSVLEPEDPALASALEDAVATRPRRRSRAR